MTMGTAALRAPGARLVPLAIAALFTATAAPSSLLGMSDLAEAKTPGKTYCYFGRCHRVRTLDETRRAVGRTTVVKASFYDSAAKDGGNPSDMTSSGERFRPNQPDNAASPLWPDGTMLLVWNPANKRTVVVRINNAGPYSGNRTLDLSRSAAERLGFARRGVATLHAKVISAPTKAEATYRRGRTYPPAPGFIGLFASIDSALLKVASSFDNLLVAGARAAAGRDIQRKDSAPERTRVAKSRKLKPTHTKLASAEPAKTKPTKTAVKAKEHVKPPRVASRNDDTRSAARRAVADAVTPAVKRRKVKLARLTSDADRRQKPSTRAKPMRTRSGASRDNDDYNNRRSRERAAVRTADRDDDERRGSEARRPAPVETANGYRFKPSRCYGWPSFCDREG
ncbi:MAG: RlpA-like double-psi beta-barrel domain-containing protein [Hyphomicrobiaceae bacterium]